MGYQKLVGGIPEIGTSNTKGNIRNSIIPSLSSEYINSSDNSSIIERRRENCSWIDLLLAKFPAVASDFRAVDAINGWIESRKKTNKKPPTDRAIELAVRKAVRFSEETPQHSVADYFDNATLNGWQGIFQFNDGQKNSTPRKNIKAAPDYDPSQEITVTKYHFDEEDS